MNNSADVHENEGQDSGAFDTRWRRLHHIRVFVARVSDPEVQRSVLLWWDIATNYCGGDYGLHGASAELHDVAAV